MLTCDIPLVRAHPKILKRLKSLKLVCSSSLVTETTEGAAAASEGAPQPVSNLIHDTCRSGTIGKIYVGIVGLPSGKDGIVLGKPFVIPRKTTHDSKKRQGRPHQQG